MSKLVLQSGFYLLSLFFFSFLLSSLFPFRSGLQKDIDNVSRLKVIIRDNVMDNQISTESTATSQLYLSSICAHDSLCFVTFFFKLLNSEVTFNCALNSLITRIKSNPYHLKKKEKKAKKTDKTRTERKESKIR